ncbi:hypothetical protein UNH65_25855 [Chitinophaga sp. 180180018-2]|nr:hypothetical protein [Chitinophaga sp. 212800010-3]
MKKYLRNWNLMRALRLVMGIIIAVQGFQSGQWMVAGLGK